tara:strand:+ start:3641 stop:3838 length:198 start_codon:yes stop_codon:yes gene_type:complete
VQRALWIASARAIFAPTSFAGMARTVSPAMGILIVQAIPASTRRAEARPMATPVLLTLIAPVTPV